MISGDLERLSKTLLYEGYSLYPYRASAIKNRHRFTFGTLFPPSWVAQQVGADRSDVQVECLVRGKAASVRAVPRFLRLVGASGEAGAWHQAVQQGVDLDELHVTDLVASPTHRPFTFSGEPGGHALSGRIAVQARRVGDDLHAVACSLHNETPWPASADREAALLSSMAAAHVFLIVTGGNFVSALDPPKGLEDEVGRCRNEGLWPVLVGKPGAADVLLASPIILYDYPQIAPESPADLFDATEIDELLTLRILTLTDREKEEMRATDERSRALLEHVDSLDEESLARLHGAVRRLEHRRSIQEVGHSSGATLCVGSKVRLRPKAGGDVFDLALANQIATVAAVEYDFEGRCHLVVTVDADPGNDLGRAGMLAHRFFFFPSDVEPLP